MGAEKIMVIATKKPLDGRLVAYSIISEPGFFIAATKPNTKPITVSIMAVVATTTLESPIVAQKPQGVALLLSTNVSLDTSLKMIDVLKKKKALLSGFRAKGVQVFFLHIQGVPGLGTLLDNKPFLRLLKDLFPRQGRAFPTRQVTPVPGFPFVVLTGGLRRT